jgi:hypothetical protein
MSLKSGVFGKQWQVDRVDSVDRVDKGAKKLTG